MALFLLWCSEETKILYSEVCREIANEEETKDVIFIHDEKTLGDYDNKNIAAIIFDLDHQEIQAKENAKMLKENCPDILIYFLLPLTVVAEDDIANYRQELSAYSGVIEKNNNIRKSIELIVSLIKDLISVA